MILLEGRRRLSVEVSNFPLQRKPSSLTDINQNCNTKRKGAKSDKDSPFQK